MYLTMSERCATERISVITMHALLSDEVQKISDDLDLASNLSAPICPADLNQCRHFYHPKKILYNTCSCSICEWNEIYMWDPALENIVLKPETMLFWTPGSKWLIYTDEHSRY